MEGPRRLPWVGLECAVMGEAPGWVSGSTALLAAGAADWGRLDAAGGPVRCFVGVLGPTAGSTADVIERLRARVTELSDEMGALAEESARITKLQRMLDR